MKTKQTVLSMVNHIFSHFFYGNLKASIFFSFLSLFFFSYRYLRKITERGGNGRPDDFSLRMRSTKKIDISLQWELKRLILTQADSFKILTRLCVLYKTFYLYFLFITTLLFISSFLSLFIQLFVQLFFHFTHIFQSISFLVCC